MERDTGGFAKFINNLDEWVKHLNFQSVISYHKQGH
jgi:hypothetical protein